MRYGLLVGVCFAVLAVVSAHPATALAADPLLASADASHAAKEEHKGGPQIFTPVRIDLGIWTLAVFLILLFLLSKFAWKPMLEGLHKREETIQGALDEARLAREEAEKMRKQFEQEMAKANDKVRELLEEARRDAQHTKDEMIGSARQEIQTERDRLHREISTAKDQALKELWDQSAKLATKISSKAIRKELKEEDHRRLVEESLAELSQANTGWAKKVF
jgi:F-type H+-transporting ATPase subunit b